MRVAVANDHRGKKAKEQVLALIKQLGHEGVDCGITDSVPVDYPDLAFQAANAVANGEVDRAILICGTGIGMSIAANKVKRVRAAVCWDELNARVSRQHNDANVLCLSGDLLGEVTLRKIVEVWLSTDFAGGRHNRRVDKIKDFENGKGPYGK